MATSRPIANAYNTVELVGLSKLEVGVLQREERFESGSMTQETVQTYWAMRMLRTLKMLGQKLGAGPCAPMVYNPVDVDQPHQHLCKVTDGTVSTAHYASLHCLLYPLPTLSTVYSIHCALC